MPAALEQCHPAEEKNISTLTALPVIGQSLNFYLLRKFIEKVVLEQLQLHLDLAGSLIPVNLVLNTQSVLPSMSDNVLQAVDTNKVSHTMSFFHLLLAHRP